MGEHPDRWSEGHGNYIYLFSMHPHVMTRLREKVMRKVGPTDRPTYDHIRDMKYLYTVINEDTRPFNVWSSRHRTSYILTKRSHHDSESVNASTLPSTRHLDKPPQRQVPVTLFF
ncbi:hypothetical protein BDR07DRAFT_1613605 [Suillus spraguei]|nr:hypothetical protein BDR07DRAFT_1613605 [Suillus spraguei]